MGTVECCCTACEVLLSEDDNFNSNFVIIAGDWINSSDSTGTGDFGFWETSSSPAGIATTVGVKAGLPWIVRSEFAPTNLTIGTTTIWRLGVGADISNYLFIEVRLKRETTLYRQKYLIGKVQSGSVSYFAETPYDDTGDAYIDANDPLPIKPQLALDEEGVLSGCFINISNETIFREVISKRDVVSLGTKAGVFVISLAGTIRFNEFELLHAYRPNLSGTGTGTGSGPRDDVSLCEDVVQSCARGLPLEEFTVEISDSTPSTGEIYSGGGGFALCNFSCTHVLGTYIVSHSGLTGTCLDTTPDTGFGDQTCYWKSSYTTVEAGCSANFEGVRVVVSITRATSPAQPLSNQRILNVGVYYLQENFSGGAFQCFFVAGFKTAISTAMEDWVIDEWINVPEGSAELPGGGTGVCNGSVNLTCRVKRHI